MTKGTVRRSGSRIAGSRAAWKNTTGPRYTLLDNGPKCNQPIAALLVANSVPGPASPLRDARPGSLAGDLSPCFAEIARQVRGDQARLAEIGGGQVARQAVEMGGQ